tara:strand:- start:113 stop:334 length:222 start_codon:yes stop_codon:yes gene_type:complete
MLALFVILSLYLRKRANLRHIQAVITVRERSLEFIKQLDGHPVIMKDEDLRCILREERMKLSVGLKSLQSSRH